jgi:uncharacterized tellurite resistance protein B-like protein
MMVATAFPHQHVALDYAFLLLTHVICADQQIHSQESRALRGLADQAKVNEVTLREMEKILEQDDTQISFEAVVQKISIGQQSEVLRQVMAIAYIDGYFSPLEREMVDRIAQLWGISQREIERMLEEAQGLRNWQTHTDDKDNQLSVEARLLKGFESILSQSLITKLAELAPKNIGQRIEQLQREILLSGPEYDDAIQQCSKIAGEDFKYSVQALNLTDAALKELSKGIQQVIEGIKQKTSGSGEYQTAKGVAEQLEQTRQQLSVEILRDLEAVREAFHAKSA